MEPCRPRRAPRSTRSVTFPRGRSWHHEASAWEWALRALAVAGGDGGAPFAALHFIIRSHRGLWDGRIRATHEHRSRPTRQCVGRPAREFFQSGTHARRTAAGGRLAHRAAGNVRDGIQRGCLEDDARRFARDGEFPPHARTAAPLHSDWRRGKSRRRRTRPQRVRDVRRRRHAARALREAAAVQRGGGGQGA